MTLTDYQFLRATKSSPYMLTMYFGDNGWVDVNFSRPRKNTFQLKISWFHFQSWNDWKVLTHDLYSFHKTFSYKNLL